MEEIIRKRLAEVKKDLKSHRERRHLLMGLRMGEAPSNTKDFERLKIEENILEDLLEMASRNEK